MTLVLPSTVEELNQLQHSFEIPSSKDFLFKGIVNKGFENIPVEKRYKREVSLPNGLENWNISNFDSYLNFEDNLVSEGFKAIESTEDRLVPEEENSRSFSSVASNMEDKRVVFQGFGVKAFNTICMDSGSTCISSDHSYVNPSDSIFRGLDAEETYQNLDLFLQQVPEVSEVNLPSPLSVSGSESSFDLPCMQTGFSLPGTTCQEDCLLEISPRGTKRSANSPLGEGDVFGSRTAKQMCSSPPPVRYTEVRRKNNIASKNCRKTRKEKQKEMEVRVSELEREKEGLRVEVQVLEELIQAHKMQLYAILQKR